MTLHRSMIAGAELAYVTRQIAADHPGLAAPAGVIAMRAQGEAEVAIEQGETRFEGVRWVTPDQIAANQVIPLPQTSPPRPGQRRHRCGCGPPTRPSLQPLTLGPPSLRPVSE